MYCSSAIGILSTNAVAIYITSGGTKWRAILRGCETQGLSHHHKYHQDNTPTHAPHVYQHVLKPLSSGNSSFGSTLYRRYPSQDKRISELLSTCSGRHAPLFLPSATFVPERKTDCRSVLVDKERSQKRERQPRSSKCSNRRRFTDSFFQGSDLVLFTEERETTIYGA
jgi:hypothetical protein